MENKGRSELDKQWEQETKETVDELDDGKRTVK